jgi:hypothetical protein
MLSTRTIYYSIVDYPSLEETLTITEGGDVASRVLFVHSLSGHLFNNHVSKNTHHGGASVVDFGIQLAGLLFGVQVLSEPANSVVSVVLGCRHPCKLNKSEEKKNLKKSGVRDSTDTISSSGDIRELQVLAGGQVSIESDMVVVDNASNDGSHGDTSVLALDGTTTFEGLGLSVEPSKGIVDTKGGSLTDLKLVDIQGDGGLSLLGRGEGGGGTSKEGGNNKLHGVLSVGTERTGISLTSS